MTVAETLLVYVGAPLAVFLLLVLLTYLPGGRKRPRWKPGQPWEHEPVWYAPHTADTADGSAGHGAPAFGAAVPGAESKAIGSSVYGEPHGSSERDGAGATASSGATSSGASPAIERAASAGPLGGARGTW